MVSAAKFRRSKSRYDQVHSQLARVTGVMESLMAELGSPSAVNTDAPAAVILVTSNRGLCGSYNTGLIRLLEALRAKIPQCEVFAIGSRGLDYLHHQDISVLGECLEPPERMTSERIRSICRQLLAEYEKKPGGQILMVSMRYINTLHQEPAVSRLMPPELPERVQMKKDADGETRGSGLAGALWPEALQREYVPSGKQVLEYLIPKYLELTLYKAVCEAAVCEHAARRTAMENASENGKEMLSDLSLRYNRARQQTITDELIEIVSGSEALKKGV